MTTRPLCDDEDAGLLQAIERVRHGDSGAFEAIYQHCYARVQSFCRRRLRWADRCIHYEEDLASEIMISIWKSICDPKVELASSDEFWRVLHRLVFERCIDRAKYNNRRKRRNELELSLLFDALYSRRLWANGVAEVDAEDLMQALLEEIPDNKVRAFVVSKLRGLSSQQIADQWQISIRTIQRTIESVRPLFDKELQLE